MKLTQVFFIALFVICTLSFNIEAAPAPGKIPVKALKKAGQVVGKGLRAINIASTVHDIASALRPKPKKRRH